MPGIPDDLNPLQDPVTSSSATARRRPTATSPTGSAPPPTSLKSKSGIIARAALVHALALFLFGISTVGRLRPIRYAILTLGAAAFAGGLVALDHGLLMVRNRRDLLEIIAAILLGLVSVLHHVRCRTRRRRGSGKASELESISQQLARPQPDRVHHQPAHLQGRRRRAVRGARARVGAHGVPGPGGGCAAPAGGHHPERESSARRRLGRSGSSADTATRRCRSPRRTTRGLAVRAGPVRPARERRGGCRGRRGGGARLQASRSRRSCSRSPCSYWVWLRRPCRCGWSRSWCPGERSRSSWGPCSTLLAVF